MKLTNLCGTLALAGVMFFVGCESKPAGGAASGTTGGTTGAAAASDNDKQYKTYYAGCLADPANAMAYPKKLGLLTDAGAPKDADAYKKWMDGYTAYATAHGMDLGKEFMGDKAKAKDFYDKNQ